MFLLRSFSIAELIWGSLFILALTVVLKYQSHVPAILQSSPGGNMCLCSPGHAVRAADGLSSAPAVYTALQEKEKVPSASSGAAQLILFWGWQALCLGARNVGVSAREILLPVQGYCQGCSCLSCPHYSSPSNMLLSIYFTKKARELLSRPATFLLHWGLIYPLTCLHALPVLLTVGISWQRDLLRIL